MDKVEILLIVANLIEICILVMLFAMIDWNAKAILRLKERK